MNKVRCKYAEECRENKIYCEPKYPHAPIDLVMTSSDCTDEWCCCITHRMTRCVEVSDDTE